VRNGERCGLIGNDDSTAAVDRPTKHYENRNRAGPLKIAGERMVLVVVAVVGGADFGGGTMRCPAARVVFKSNVAWMGNRKSAVPASGTGMTSTLRRLGQDGDIQALCFIMTSASSCKEIVEFTSAIICKGY